MHPNLHLNIVTLRNLELQASASDKFSDSEIREFEYQIMLLLCLLSARSKVADKSIREAVTILKDFRERHNNTILQYSDVITMLLVFDISVSFCRLSLKKYIFIAL